MAPKATCTPQCAPAASTAQCRSGTCHKAAFAGCIKLQTLGKAALTASWPAPMPSRAQSGTDQRCLQRRTHERLCLQALQPNTDVQQNYSCGCTAWLLPGCLPREAAHKALRGPVPRKGLLGRSVAWQHCCPQSSDPLKGCSSPEGLPAFCLSSCVALRHAVCQAGPPP